MTFFNLLNHYKNYKIVVEYIYINEFNSQFINLMFHTFIFLFINLINKLML